MSASAKRPWMKFYPADWQADQALRVCSLAARGLWLECLAVMHRAQPYGHLLINGAAPNDAQLAVLAGARAKQVAALMGELEQAGVFSRTRAGAVYSRRMVRDEKKARLAIRNGKAGGNPSLCQQSPIAPSDKPSLKRRPPHAPKAQIPETRNQKSISIPSENRNDAARAPAAVLLTGDAIDAARAQAPGYDIYYLEAIYSGWARDKDVRDHKAAFLSFVRTHVRHNPI